jgi:glycosyltransferase involved in cell wall biosynthesis
MRIVIDMQGAQTESRFRGIGRYTLSLTQALVRNRGEHEIVLALNGMFPDTIEPIRAAFDDLLPQENIRVWYAPGPVQEDNEGNDSRREVAELIREAFFASLEPDIIHITSLFEGFVDNAVTSISCFDRSTPVSVALHDLIPLLNPDHYLQPNTRYAHYYMRKIEHLKRAAIYLAVSESSRQEGILHLHANKDRVFNTSEGVQSCFRPLHIDYENACALRNRFSLTRPFVLSAGGADNRKNLPRLIQAFAGLPATVRSGHQLLLAGKLSHGDRLNLKHHAKEASLTSDEVCFTGYVTDEELAMLYNLCKLFVFPSWHEGFGLPALEAMACGAPVIGANTSSLPEVIGLDTALFDPFDVAAIAAKITVALRDDEFRTSLTEHGLQQAGKFTWDESAKRAIAAWEMLPESKQIRISNNEPTGRKPKLAYVSPLEPERTGIAKYSAELLPALALHYDIEVIVAQDRVDDHWVNRYGKARDVLWLRTHANEIDRVLYQIGNSPFHQHMPALLQDIPGTVVLHDFYMSGLMSWLELHAGDEHAWTQSLYAAHGYGSVRDRYQDPEAAKRIYPTNLDILQHAQGVIVHSDYSRKLASHWYRGMSSRAWAIIPHLRVPAESFSNREARKQLGMSKDDFIVCSFGFLDMTKLNHRLLSAWALSAMAEDNKCKLIFVGENHGGDYGKSLAQKIRSIGLGDRIRITGFATQELYQLHLMAADIAVQLRTHSRGETSGTVLDCMNYALPVIVNANGAIGELDADAVWMLPDEFDDTALTDALESLWQEPERRRALGQRAQRLIRERHAPTVCAQHYKGAIEDFYHRRQTATPVLIREVAAHKTHVSDDGELITLAKCISDTLPLPHPAKRLFLDVSATCHNDLKTGIERVTRALVLALIETPPAGYRIEPVYLSNTGVAWHYRYGRSYTLGLLGCPPSDLADDIIDFDCGDILVTLDLSGDTLVQAQRAGVFSDLRNRGVMVYSMVHDLLPISMPEVFPSGADASHADWLQAISQFDGAICVSKAVADDLITWQEKNGFDWKGRRTFRVAWSHHGADFRKTAPSSGLPNNAARILNQIQTRPTFLMVGTIEPRKGYLQAIEAFGQLWKEGIDVNLIIVGKEGWQDLPNDRRRSIPETVQYLKTHNERDKRLFWLEDISDEYLEMIYAVSTCLIASSKGEGFGLPLIEAAQHRLRIIARDIPVFREVAGEHAFYFTGFLAVDIARAIKDWLVLYSQGIAPNSKDLPWLTWKESAFQLTKAILLTSHRAEKNVD